MKKLLQAGDTVQRVSKHNCLKRGRRFIMSVPVQVICTIAYIGPIKGACALLQHYGR